MQIAAGCRIASKNSICLSVSTISQQQRTMPLGRHRHTMHAIAVPSVVDPNYVFVNPEDNANYHPKEDGMSS
jgi:hypothetical protein